MNIKNYILYIFIQLCCITFVFTQGNYSVGYLPAINLNTKIAKLGSINFNYQQRNSLYRSEEARFNHDYVLSDFTVIYDYKIGLYSKIGIGGLLRYENQEYVTRTLQQYSNLKQINKLKLVNRIRTDQTYFSDFIEFRLRYRIGLQIPLNGTEVDTKELYLKINNEYLNSYSESSYDLETRLITNLGFVLNKQSKLEIGIDYRLSNLVSKPLNHNIWTTFSAYFSIK